MRRHAAGSHIWGPGGLPLAFFIVTLSAFSPWLAQAETTVGVFAGKSLDFNQSPVCELLLTALSREPGIALLEREQVERILEEQSLQLALSAEGGEARRRFGSLLKSDLLVVLEAEKRKNLSVLRLVAGDASTGLRLVKSERLWDENSPQETANGLLSDIKDAVRKQSETVRRIAAVSPFMSEDLERTHDDLQRVYASIVEECLSRTPGLLLVELQEAQALAKEFTLTNSEPVKRLQLPVYFLGKYRNDGRGKDLRVTIQVEIREGDHQIGDESSNPMEPSAAPSFLQTAASRLTAMLLEREPTPFDPLVEAGQLAQRAEEFTRIGEFEQALALYEACLLLKPELKVFHRPAFLLCGAICRQWAEGKRGERDKSVSGDRAFDYALRSLDHLEILLYAIYPGELRDLHLHMWNEINNVFGILAGSLGGSLPPPLAARRIDYYSRRDEIIISFFEGLHSRGILNQGILNKVDIGGFFGEHSNPRASLNGSDFVPPPLTVHQEMRLIRVLNAFPREVYTLYKIIDPVTSAADPPEEAKNLLLEVEAFEGETVQLALQVSRLMKAPLDQPGLLDQMEEAVKKAKSIEGGVPNIPQMLEKKIEIARSRSIPTPTPTPGAGVVPPGTRKPATIFTFQREKPDVIFHPIVNLLPLPVRSGQFGVSDIWVSDWLKLDQGIDAILRTRNLYLMKKKGEVEEIVHLEDKEEGHLSQMIWDGKWLWVIKTGGKPDLLVIDPRSGELDSINSDDGLPAIEEERRGLALSPGKIFLCGFGDRTWVGTVSYGGPGKKLIDLIHEFRNALGDKTDLETAFSAFNMGFTEDAAGQAKESVWVERVIHSLESARISALADKPLIVDLANRSVSLGPPRPRFRESVEPSPSGRFGSRRDPMMERREQHEMSVRAEANDKLFAIRTDAVWQIESDGKTVQKVKELSGKPPALPSTPLVNRRVFQSNYFGLVYQMDGDLYQTEFKE